MRDTVFAFFLGCVMVLFDTISKAFVFQNHSILNLPFVELHRNFYFAFSLPVKNSVTACITTALLIPLCIYVADQWRSMSRAQKYAWTCVFAGAVANILDRLAYGYAHDFLKIGTGYFNFADIYICVGIAAILFAEHKTQKQNSKQ